MQDYTDITLKTSEEIESMVKMLNARDYSSILNTINTLIFAQEANKAELAGENDNAIHKK